MNKKIFTDESLTTLVEEIKSYTNDAVSECCTKIEVENLELITVSDIDTICGVTN